MEQRPFTAAERKILGESPSPRSPGHLLWDIGIWSFGSMGCLGAIAVLAIVAVTSTLHAARVVTGVLSFTAVGVLTVIALISTLMKYSVARRKELHAWSGVQADLDGGLAAVERHRATAAVRAIMDVTRERAYYLRLEDGRGLFVGFWGPPEHDNPADLYGQPPDLPSYPTVDVEVARGPKTGRVLSVTFSGPTLPVSTTFEQAQEADADYVEVGGIVPVAWEEIQKTYGC